MQEPVGEQTRGEDLEVREDHIGGCGHQRQQDECEVVVEEVDSARDSKQEERWEIA